MFPHTITVYYEAENDMFETVTEITVLKGVLVDAVKAVNVRESGLENADSVTVYIPYDARAWDGLTLLDKAYAPPKEYEAAEDKSGLWTLDTENGYFIKGEVISTEGFRTVNGKYDDVYRITKVDNKDFGGLKHFEVGGR